MGLKIGIYICFCEKTKDENLGFGIGYNAPIIDFHEEGGPRANVGNLQTSSEITPNTGTLFFVKLPHCPRYLRHYNSVTYNI